MKKKTIAIISGIIAFSIVAGLISLFAINNSANEFDTEAVKLKKNVSVITSETTDVITPYKVDDDNLYYKENPNLEIDDVIVSGITEAAPTGFMRKVANIERNNGEFIVKTTQATFQEVFKKVDFEDAINLNGEKDETPVIETQKKWYSPTVTPLNYDSEAATWFGFKDKTIDNETIYASVDGTFDSWVFPKIKAENGDLYFDFRWEDNIDSKIYFYNFGYVNEKIVKELYRTSFLPREFYIGNVPVVMTNEIWVDFVFNGSINAETVGVTSSIKMKNKVSEGFIYNSKDDSYSENDSAQAINNTVKLDIDGKSDIYSDIGLRINHKISLYDDFNIESFSGLNCNFDGKVNITNDSHEGEVKATILSNYEVSFVPCEPLCNSNASKPVKFERWQQQLWDDTFIFDGLVAPGEEAIKKHFNNALEFYDMNIYGRDYRVTKEEQPTQPFPGCLNWDGEWLAPNESFSSYDDYLEQCGEYFNDSVISMITHEIGAQNYKGHFYSRFNYGVGDVCWSEYLVDVKEVGTGSDIYYEVTGSFENIAGEQVEVNMICSYEEGKWVFNSYDFYGMND